MFADEIPGLPIAPEVLAHPHEYWEGRCKATWKKEFKFSWREAVSLNHLDEKEDSDEYVVNKELSLLACPQKITPGGWGREMRELIAANIYDKYSIVPSIRPICARYRFTMKNMIQLCSDCH